MATENPDVVIVGGGIVGIATAYFLGRAGVRSTVVERDAVGSHASGFAFGGLSPLAGSGIPVAVVMAGGYAPDVQDTVDVHVETVRAAVRSIAGMDSFVSRQRVVAG